MDHEITRRGIYPPFAEKNVKKESKQTGVATTVHVNNVKWKWKFIWEERSDLRPSATWSSHHKLHSNATPSLAVYLGFRRHALSERNCS